MSQPLINCAWSEFDCKNKARSKGFCLKHYPRGILLASAKEKGIRVCDDGKRACRNETFNNKLKCEECLCKTREKEMNEYNERKEKGVCTMCGVELKNLIKGLKDKPIQKCERCYSTMRKVEDKREDRQRNYAFEKKINPLGHFREYADGAAKRNLFFELTLDQFTEIVTKPCYYCKKYEETEVIGIDRINSFIGYNLENIVPCCKLCNNMKQQLTVNEFALQIKNIYIGFAKTLLQVTDTTEIFEEEIMPSHRLRPREIVSLYSKKKLDTYIELCKTDERSSSYIQKLIDATKYSMTNEQFRNYLENSSRTEIRSQQLTLQNDRKRVPRKEIYCLLDSSKYLEVIKLYESVFGKTKEIRADMKELVGIWKDITGDDKKKKLESLFIKYNNFRAYMRRTGGTEDMIESQGFPQNFPEFPESPDNQESPQDFPESSNQPDFPQDFPDFPQRFPDFPQRFPEVPESPQESQDQQECPHCEKSCSKTLYDKGKIDCCRFCESCQDYSTYDENTWTYSDDGDKCPKHQQQPTQWKISNIYTYLTTGRESIYLEYLKQNNPSIKDLDERLAILLTQIKKGPEPIKAFILELRSIRHNALCYAKNDKLIDREDREIWRSETILRAFKLNQLEKFKQFTEDSTGDLPENPAWCKRWNRFVEFVTKETDDTNKKGIISRFLTSQRTKKFRRSKNSLT